MAKKKKPTLAPAAPPPPPPPTDDELTAFIQQTYGHVAALLDIPELRNLLFDAARNKWDEARLQGALSQTDWWRTNSATAREWDILIRTDPAEADRRRELRRQEVRQLASTLGVALGDEGVERIMDSSLRFGWTGNILERAVRAEFRFDPAVKGGIAGVTLDGLKTMARQWGIPLSDQTLQQWVEQIVRGDTQAESFELYLKEQAKSRWPGLTGAIDQGISPGQYFAPYREVAAQELGINPALVDIADPKWSRAVETNPQTGGVMTLYEWMQELRANPVYGWKFGPRAKEAAFEMADKLQRALGKVG